MPAHCRPQRAGSTALAPFSDFFNSGTMLPDRSWMYKGRRKRGEVTAEWISKTTDFLEWAFSRDTGIGGVLCPCNYCNNTRPQTRDMMIKHLCKYGFKPEYTVWVYHGETFPTREDSVFQNTEDAEINRIDDMIDNVCDAYVKIESLQLKLSLKCYLQQVNLSTNAHMYHNLMPPHDY